MVASSLRAVHPRALRWALLFTVFAGGLVRPVAAAPSYQQRLEFLKAEILKSLDTFEAEMAKPGARIETRDFTTYAHWSLALGRDPARAHAALRRAMALQTIDENAPNHGEFAPFEGGSPPARDGASTGTETSVATEFTALPIAQILMRYPDKLPDDLKAALTERVKAAGSLMRAREVAPDAGNIFLLNAVNLLLIGEITRDDRMLAEAASRLDQFLVVARARGINEYVSPNYTAVQLSALLVGHNYTTQPESRRLLERGLRFLWAQIAANTMPQRGMLGGPHSRDNDFTFGLGHIDCYLLLEGLRDPAPLTGPLSEGLRAGVNYIENCWRPDEKILGLARTTPRIVTMRWGTLRGQDRYFYVTNDYGIGSSSATYASNDKKLTIEFPTPRPIPLIWVVADPFDAPYGRVKSPKTGQPIRPIHLREQIAAVQEKDTVLALMNLRPDVKGTPAQSVATNIIFPSKADAVVLDGKPLAMDKPFELPVTTNSTLFVRVGGSAAVLRIFAADGVGSFKPQLFIKHDGNPYGMARLVAYHYQQGGGASGATGGALPGTGASPSRRPTLVPDAVIRSGVIMLAGKCGTDAEAKTLLARAAALKVEDSVNANAWTAKLVDGETTLEAGLDLVTGNVLARKVNGNEYQTTAFEVNGKDLGLEYLGL